MYSSSQSMPGLAVLKAVDLQAPLGGFLVKVGLYLLHQLPLGGGIGGDVVVEPLHQHLAVGILHGGHRVDEDEQGLVHPGGLRGKEGLLHGAAPLLPFAGELKGDDPLAPP